MILKFNRDIELWIVGFGVHKPGEIKEIADDTLAKSMLETGYFNEIKKRERKIKVKKSKKKGDDKLCQLEQEDILELKKKLPGAKR